MRVCELLSVDLRGMRSLQEMQQRIAAQRQDRCCRRVDRRRRLGPHAVGGRKAANPPGHRRGERRASGSFHPGGWSYLGRQHGGAEGGRNHRRRRQLRRAAKSITMPTASRPESCAKRREDWSSPKIPPPTPVAAAPRRRTCTGRCRAVGHHLGPGQFQLGRLPHLRRHGARRQADAAHQRMARFNDPVRPAGDASRASSRRRPHAAHRHAERLHGWVAGFAHGRAAGAVFRRSRQLRPAAI